MASRNFVSCAVCVCIFLAIILIWVGIFAGIGITNLATPSQRPQRIEDFNTDVKAWENQYRSKLLSLTPPPTVKYDNQAVALHKDVNNVDTVNDSAGKDEVINTKYAQLRLQSEQTQLFATGAWNPMATKTIVINAGAEEKQYTVPLMVERIVYMTESKSSDRATSCRRMDGYYKGDKQCALYYYLSGVCTLIDSSTGRLVNLPGASEPGCGLKNILTSLPSSFDFSVGEYKKAPAGTSALTSNGNIVLRDIRDPYVQLGFRSRGTFNFGMSKAAQSTIGIVLLVIGLLPGAICFLCLLIGACRYIIIRRRDDASSSYNSNYEMVPNSQPTGENQQPFLENNQEPQYQPYSQPQQGGYQPTGYAPQ